ncbi:30S ribosomal protein S13, chloroplastic [Sesamum alatum]|uniref:30S ribosomal protein S13, chloroplastic n=1 Tax=Sesamum alatum TaxID=300844 RepID=A0AAE1YGN9_9LAMI|nr:30S ribosomal protein S13, chloroplastic [Sesamum alatum]
MAQALATPVLPSLSLISNPISNSAKTSLSFPLTTTLPKIGGLSIKCAVFGGVEIPNNKRVGIFFAVHSWNRRTTAKQILNEPRLENKITKDFSEEELTTLREERRFNALAIRRLKEIQCYRGVRTHSGITLS